MLAYNRSGSFQGLLYYLWMKMYDVLSSFKHCYEMPNVERESAKTYRKVYF